jgi:hypothetical protein
MSRQPHRIGIIGGSGLYHIDGLTDTRWVRVKTPFGPPSDELLTGRLAGRDVVFLPATAAAIACSPPNSPTAPISGPSRSSASPGSQHQRRGFPPEKATNPATSSSSTSSSTAPSSLPPTPSSAAASSPMSPSPIPFARNCASSSSPRPAPQAPRPRRRHLRLHGRPRFQHPRRVPRQPRRRL